MMVTIGVVGSARRGDEELPAHMLEVAEAVGRGVARAGAVLVSGGTGGVMEAASRGAKLAGGLTVGFLPQADLSHANPHLDLAFPTGLGTLRNALTARCCDAIVAIGGGVGTLNELTMAYDARRPIVVVEGTTGWSDRLRAALVDGAYLDDRRVVAVSFVDTADAAVRLALERAAEPRGLAAGSPLTGWAGL
ncbi:MAG: TIGR00725 family protein [Microbacteriaceae bacterium]